METTERLEGYARQRGYAFDPDDDTEVGDRKRLTGPQRRRATRKDRYQHAHGEGRCEACRPLPRSIPQLIRPGIGPRDWFQGRPLSVGRARGYGKRPWRVGPAPVRVVDEAARFPQR